MTDRRLERRLLGRSFGVDVDPLVIVGGIRKLVDSFLADLDPIADGYFLTDQGRHFSPGYFAFCHEQKFTSIAGKNCSGVVGTCGKMWIPSVSQTGSAVLLVKPKLGVIGETFRAFRYRNFRWMWFGAFTSTTGFFVQQVAESWYIYTKTDSPGLLGLTAFLNGAPILLFSLFGGVLADRMDRRHLLIGSQILQMSAALALALLFFTERIEVWHIMMAAFTAGLGQAFGGPAYQALIPSLLPKKHLPNGIALMSIQFNLAGVIGRPIGGAAFKYLGATTCFFVNGLSFLAVIFSLLVVRVKFVPKPGQGNMLFSLIEGLKSVFTNPPMRSLMLLSVVTALCGVPLLTLLPVFARDTFGLDASGFSVLSAIVSLGAVLGALAVARLGNSPGKGRRSLRMQVLLGAAVLLFVLTDNLFIGAGLLLICGGAILAVFAMMNSLVQLNADEQMRGRIMSVYNTAFRGAMPIGNLVSGLAADKLGARGVMGFNGVTLILVASYFLFGGNRMKDL